MGFSLKKLGNFVKKSTGVSLSDFDPTYSKAKFGGAVRTGLAGVTGGASEAAIGGLKVAGAAVKNGKVTLAAPPADPKSGPAPTGANALPAATSRNLAIGTVGMVAALTVGLYLVLRK